MGGTLLGALPTVSAVKVSVGANVPVVPVVTTIVAFACAQARTVIEKASAAKIFLMVMMVLTSHFYG